MCGLAFVRFVKGPGRKPSAESHRPNSSCIICDGTRKNKFGNCKEPVKNNGLQCEFLFAHYRQTTERIEIKL